MTHAERRALYFWPVSLAYEPELKVGFCVDKAGRCGYVRVSPASRAKSSIVPASWWVHSGGRVYAPYGP